MGLNTRNKYIYIYIYISLTESLTPPKKKKNTYPLQ